MKVKSEREVAQSCPTLSNPMACSLTGSSVHGIFQARVLEWGAIAFSRTAYNVSSILKGKKCWSSGRASLVAQLVKNSSAIQETPVRFLSPEDLLEKGMATHSSIVGLPLWLSW